MYDRGAWSLAEHRETSVSGISQIDIHAARTLLDDGRALFVDIRDPVSFRSGHVPGAHHLTDRTVEAFLETADKDRPIVVYCYHGHSSLTASAWLQQKGFSDVTSMAGGFEAWRAAYPEATAIAPRSD